VKHRAFAAGAACLVALPFATSSYAADTAVTGQPVEEIVVTGSYIKGSAENAALPVDVVTNQDLQDQGNPTMIEFIRQLGITSGNLGETNQFTAPAQGTEGTTTINLRGLGAGRTLTLINGRRQVSTETNGVDVSAFPLSAFARTEILKDGAAALYGSDAIAGVVNFITHEGFEGFEIGGTQSWMQDSSANNINALAGWANDRMNGFLALEFDHRGELHIDDRNWGIKPFVDNLAGGWSSTGMPGTIYMLDPNKPPSGNGGLAGSNQQQPIPHADPQCAALGGEVLFGTCNFQFSHYDNLVEKTNTYKSYGEFNWDISDSAKFHVEALYSYLNMPHWNSSPAYPPNSLFGPDRVIPATNPGLIQFKADYPALFTNLPVGTDINTVEVYDRARYLGVNGIDGKGISAYRRVQTYRLATGVSGEAFDGAFGYNLNVSWSRRDRKSNGYDVAVQNMAFALNGLGGPNCTPGGADPATSTAGQGPCQWFNPFSEAIAYSAAAGVGNPTFVPAVANSKELLQWLRLEGSGREINELLVWDAVFDKELDIKLPGGNVGVALGFQARNEHYNTELSDVSNRAVDPCPWTNPFAVTMGFTTPDQLSPNCFPKNGLVGFGVPGDEANTSRTVYAAFSELALPILDNLNMQAAIRYEDYGSQGGSTVDPKVAIKWQALDWLAFRGSASTTFRGPPLSQLSGVNTYLANIPAANAYRAVNIIGNPNLNPESAVTTSVGTIVEAGGFTGTIDYWHFQFRDPLQFESANQLLSAYTVNGCFDGGAGAPVGGPIAPICVDLRPHIEPLGTTPADLAAINTNYINGPKIRTEGVDIAGQYVWDFSFGQVTLGVEGTHTLQYQSDTFRDVGGVALAPGGDFNGLMNINLNPFYPMPDWKGNAFLRYARDNWRASYTVRYTSDYRDKQVAAINAANASLQDVDSMTTQDVTVIYTWKDFMFSGSVYNLTDEDPPQCYCAQEFDPYTANPLGRIYKFQVTYTFGPTK
jgi:iron complex outermembrane receptor protein